MNLGVAASFCAEQKPPSPPLARRWALTWGASMDICSSVSDKAAVSSENKKVEFEGQITSLSGSDLTVIQRIGYTWKQIADPDYWEYEGEPLAERRRRMED